MRGYMGPGATKAIGGAANCVRRIAMPSLALAACAAALFAAQSLSHNFDYHAVIKTLRPLSPDALARSLLATLISYLALVGRDAAGLRALGVRVPRGLVWIGAI